MGHLWVSAHRVAPTPTSPQSPEEAEGPWRCPTNPKHTYRRECKEGDGKDGEAGGNGLPHPRLRHLVPVADGGDCDLRAGGQQAAVSPEPQDRRSAQNLRTGGQPRTSGQAVSPEPQDGQSAPEPQDGRSAPEPQDGRLSSQRPLHPRPAACKQRPGREPCTDGLGSSEARAPAHRVWSPNLTLQRKQVHGVCTGAWPPCTTPTPCQGGPPPRMPGAPTPGPSSTESLATDGALLPDASLGTRCFMRPFFWENQMSRLVHGGAAVHPGCVPE